MTIQTAHPPILEFWHNRIVATQNALAAFRALVEAARLSTPPESLIDQVMTGLEIANLGIWLVTPWPSDLTALLDYITPTRSGPVTAIQKASIVIGAEVAE